MDLGIGRGDSSVRVLGRPPTTLRTLELLALWDESGQSARKDPQESGVEAVLRLHEHLGPLDDQSGGLHQAPARSSR